MFGSEKIQLGIHLSNDVIRFVKKMLSVAKGFITGFNSVPGELDSLKTNVFAGDGIQLHTDTANNFKITRQF